MEKNSLPELHTNISGKIRNTKLPIVKSLWPIFEAISNSIHAIEDKKSTNGLIEIRVSRQGSIELLKECSEVEIYPISDIEIVDNGIGLNEENFNSFLTAESDFKIERGAKGIGRFVCLKAFKNLKFTSVFKDEGDNLFYQREFVFKPEGKGIYDYSLTPSQTNKVGTKVSLISYLEGYQKTCPKKLEDISEKIIEHFLVTYINHKAPRIELVESINGFRINLDSIFNTQFRASIRQSNFQLYGKKFNINLVRLFDSKKGHRIHYCGNDRVVKEEKLNKYIPDLGVSIVEEDNNYFTYQVYVTSSFLDEHVDTERIDFDFPENIDDANFNDLVEDEPNLERIREKIIEVLEVMLTSYLTNVRMTKFDTYSDYISEYAPQFKALLKYRPDVVKKMSPNLTGTKLNIELFKVQTDLEVEVKELGEKILNESNSFKDSQDYIDLYEEYIEKFNDIGKANLAKYIVHRKSVIELLDKFLGVNEDDEFYTEDTIHKIFFPIKKESDEITFEQQNLWLIDERLSYHSYLSSDKSFKEIKVVEDSGNLDRPDLLIFNNSFSFVNDEAPHNSFVIVEFKRPERKDYNTRDKKKNPIDQVLSYISTIRANTAKDRRGKIINIDKDRTPFYAYIICDFNENITKLADEKNFKQTPDGLGYFYFHDKFNAYIELTSYSKLLKDAKNRNRILFDKLGLPS
ncbi:ATP-binding protein [Pedobacter arcticus]|uniref:ATP-binding protein n=1 Tax=Pedobacter arcticus TaxID=752140 RepID=UPI00031A9889|nr:ATP-binding protein [Pedobacter arcticus]